MTTRGGRRTVFRCVDHPSSIIHHPVFNVETYLQQHHLEWRNPDMRCRAGSPEIALTHVTGRFCLFLLDFPAFFFFFGECRVTLLASDLPFFGKARRSRAHKILPSCPLSPKCASFDAPLVNGSFQLVSDQWSFNFVSQADTTTCNPAFSNPTFTF